MFSELFSPYKYVLVALFRKPTFLACNPEQVYAVILESSKNSDVLQNRQTYSRRILEISRIFLDMLSVRPAYYVRVNSEGTRVK